MRKLTLIALLLASLLPLSGCRGVIRKAAIRDNAKFVLDRHDAYVSGDVTLKNSVKFGHLNDSRGARAYLQGSGTVKASDLAKKLRPCLDRHDAYIRADESLKKIHRRTYLRSTVQLRGVLTDAGS